DVNAIDGAGPGALVAADAGGQIKAMEAAVARLDRHGQLGVLEVLCERFSPIRLKEIPQRDVEPLPDGGDRLVDIAEPLAHGTLARVGCLPWNKVNYMPSIRALASTALAFALGAALV